jgi:hypothetical protein
VKDEIGFAGNRSDGWWIQLIFLAAYPAKGERCLLQAMSLERIFFTLYQNLFHIMIKQ